MQATDEKEFMIGHKIAVLSILDLSCFLELGLIPNPNAINLDYN
jgi:hypothetical protein